MSALWGFSKSRESAGGEGGGTTNARGLDTHRHSESRHPRKGGGKGLFEIRGEREVTLGPTSNEAASAERLFSLLRL